MIQFSDDGRVPAAPVKSSLHTGVQPDSGAGSAAVAAVAASPKPATTSAAEATKAGPRRGRGSRNRWGLSARRSWCPRSWHSLSFEGSGCDVIFDPDLPSSS
jgi:hypothetical protein